MGDVSMNRRLCPPFFLFLNGGYYLDLMNLIRDLKFEPNYLYLYQIQQLLLKVCV